MLNFEFLEKGLGIASPPNFILLTDQILLSHCLYFLRYWTIYVVIVCFPDCDVINFEINLYLSNQAVFLSDQEVKKKIIS